MKDLTCKRCGVQTSEIKMQDIDSTGWQEVGWSYGAGWRGICPLHPEDAGEAYDLETCERFERLSHDLFHADRIAWGARQRAIQAVVVCESATQSGPGATYGQFLPGELAEPEDYEAL